MFYNATHKGGKMEEIIKFKNLSTFSKLGIVGGLVFIILILLFIILDLIV